MRRPGLGLSRDNTRIFVAMAFNEGAFGAYQTLWPLYIAALGASPPQIGVVMGMMGVGRLLALLPSGMIADRVSPKRVIVGGRALTALGMFLLTVATGWWQLIPFGIILSAGNVAFPAISSTIAENAGPGRQRTRAFRMIYTAGPSVTLLVTPALGGLLADWYGLRATYVLAAALTAAALAAFTTITPRPITHQSGPPVTYGSTLAHRPVLLVCLLELVTLFTLTLGVTLIPNYLQDVHGLDTGLIGVLGSVAAAGSILLGLAIGHVPLFQRPLAAIGLSVAVVGGTLVLTLAGRSLGIFALAYLLRGGYFVAWSLFAAALGEIASERFRSRAFALGEILGGLGFSVAPFFAGWLYDIDPAAPLVAGLSLIAPLLVGIAIIARLVGHEPAAVLAEERI